MSALISMVMIQMLFSVCDCHPEGTMDESNGLEKCLSSDGTCDCNDGYLGSRCDQCTEGYYSSGTNPLQCSGKNRNKYILH